MPAVRRACLTSISPNVTCQLITTNDALFYGEGMRSLALKLLPAGLQGPVMPAPTMLTALPLFFRALQALGEDSLSGASGVLSTGSTRNAPAYLSLPAIPQQMSFFKSLLHNASMRAAEHLPVQSLVAYEMGLAYYLLSGGWQALLLVNVLLGVLCLC